MNVIIIMDNFLSTIKKGTLSHQQENENIICDRCHKNNVKVYINFLHNDLCLECVDTITDLNEKNKINILPKPIPLIRMNQNIFKNNNLLTRMQQNLYSIRNITNFVIMEKISENEFKVMINQSVQILSPVKIANKFWNYLSESDRTYFIKYIT